MVAYYSEWEPYCAKWLRNLITAGLIPAGDVDERDIREVSSDDLKGYGQVHLFAGIAGWPLALELAGWSDDREVWTGSCPCQPLSSAGQRKGHADERHLWPAFYELIAERRPATVLGEQIAGKDGREWLAGVRADLEHLGYAVGAADLPAAGVGAPHIRQRLWWVGRLVDAQEQRTNGKTRDIQQEDGGSLAKQGGITQRAGEVFGGLGNAARNGRVEECQNPRGRGEGSGQEGREQRPGHNGVPSGLGHSGDTGPPRAGQRAQHQSTIIEPSNASTEEGTAINFWSDFNLIPCADGKARRVEPGIQPLAHGVRARVGKLRAAGNAITPQVAAEFIGAVMMVRP